MSATVQYDLRLGGSFHATSSQGSEYVLMRYASKPNISNTTEQETHCKRNAEGRYLVSWNNNENDQITYEGNENSTQDMDCLLLYDEESHSFVLERPRLLLNMRKARKSQVAGEKAHITAPAESAGREPAVPQGRSDVENTSEDDFEMDIYKGMEELLEEDDDEEDTKPTAVSAMEDVKSSEPVLIKPLEPAVEPMEVNPQSPVARPEVKSATNSPRINERRRKPVLASTPIRRPLTTTSLPSSPAKPLTIISTPVMKNTTSSKQKSTAQSSSESSSGSSDSGSSSSGSEDNDSSSGSGSDSDDDFANLAENISQSLDSGITAPSINPNRLSGASVSTSTNPSQPGANKPRSLRAFLDGEDEPMADDDAITSSSDSE